VHTLDLRDRALGDAIRTRLCWLYYDTIYQAAFPVADEAEDPTVWLPLLSSTPPLPAPIVHVLLAVADARPPQEIDSSSLLGGLIFEYFRTSQTALATYLCTRPDLREHGVARFLLARALDALRSEAGPLPVPLFAEAEEPGKQTDPAVRQIAIERLPILARLGFRKIPIRYRQPALGPGKQPLDNLSFLLFTDGKPATISSSVLRAFMREFYAGLKAGPPDEDWMFGGLAGEDIFTLPLDELA